MRHTKKGSAYLIRRRAQFEAIRGDKKSYRRPGSTNAHKGTRNKPRGVR